MKEFDVGVFSRSIVNCGIIGVRASGKTTLAKHLTEVMKCKGNVVGQYSDSSWWDLEQVNKLCRHITREEALEPKDEVSFVVQDDHIPNFRFDGELLDFQALFEEATTDYGCLVIDNTVATTDVNQTLKKYRVPPFTQRSQHGIARAILHMPRIPIRLLASAAAVSAAPAQAIATSR